MKKIATLTCLHSNKVCARVSCLSAFQNRTAFFKDYPEDTVLAAMTFPAILYGTNHMISAIAGLAVAVFIAYKGKGLLIVAVGACSAVFVAELVLMVVR